MATGNRSVMHSPSVGLRCIAKPEVTSQMNTYVFIVSIGSIYGKLMIYFVSLRAGASCLPKSVSPKAAGSLLLVRYILLVAHRIEKLCGNFSQTNFFLKNFSKMHRHPRI